jgi:hypothetical protein
MSWSQKENAIREKRTIEATKKNLMSPSGRLGVIAKVLGSPIIRQSSGLWDVNLLDDPYEDFSDTEYEKTTSGQQGPQMYKDEILTAGDEFAEEEGYVFDGLSRGMHLEIKYWHVNHKLEVSWRGHEVYKEIGGELAAYAPYPEWEDMIGRLYKAAKTQAKDQISLEEVEIGEAIERKKRSLWEKLKTRWGL